MFETERKKIFPMFKNNPDMVYLDNAALTFKPQSVIDRGNEFYEKFSISSRTSDSKLGAKISTQLQDVRKKIANFVNSEIDEIIFSSGTTDGLNQIAKMLSSIISSGRIIFSYLNHSSAIVPFLENFKNKNIQIKYCLNQEEIINNIDKDTKIVILPQKSNNFQENYDLKKIYEICRKNNTILINDAAQAIIHDKIDFSNTCDVMVFSGNKLYGPTGTGALIIKKELLAKLSPNKWGGGQVQNILNDFNWVPRNTATKWEPGTPNFAGILQLGEAISFFENYEISEIISYEKELANYTYDSISKIKNIEIDSKRGDSIILFNIKNIPSQEVASYLGNRNIYVRAGSFCAYKFKEINKLNNSYVRISLALYNNKSDINKLVKALKNGGNFIEIF